MNLLPSWTLPALFTLFLAGCGVESNSSDQQSDIRRGIGGEPASLDPASAADTFSVQIVQDLYEGLVQEGANGEILPAVASSWDVDEGGTKYTFHLRPNARWSNGQPVRARDFVAAWQRVVDPRDGSLVSNDLRLVAGAVAIISGKAPPSSLGVFATTDHELVVRLDQPAPYFPQLLTHSSTFPVFSDVVARSHDAKSWISNGAYVLSEWRPGTELKLTKNRFYWDSGNVRIAQVHYLICVDQFAQFSQYRAGQIDITDTIPSNALAALRKDNPNEVVIAPYSAVAYYGVNVTTHPFAENRKLRQALSMSIDRKKLVESLSAGQVAAFGIVPPGTWNYSSASMEWATQSDSERIAKAKQLYTEAGYSEVRPLQLRVLLNSNPAIKQTAILIAAMWKQELGVDSTLTDEEFRVFLQSRRDKKRWDVIRLSWNADYNDASNFLDIFRSTSVNNDIGYSNPQFDAALDLASTTLDSAKRSATLKNAEEILLADYATIPLYFFVSKHLVKPYVLGLTPNAFDRIRTQSLALAPH